MKSTLYLLKKWWIIAAVFIGIRSKDDLREIENQQASSKHPVHDITLDEFEINTYHS
jgi:hypothetical protein